jgi:hypothetical protein
MNYFSIAGIKTVSIYLGKRLYVKNSRNVVMRSNWTFPKIAGGSTKCGRKCRYQLAAATSVCKSSLERTAGRR